MIEDYPGHEIRYQATLWGKGIRKRCRKEETIIRALGWADTIEVPPELQIDAIDYLRNNYREVKNARIEVKEVYYQEGENGWFSTVEPLEAPKFTRHILKDKPVAIKS